ncbi:MAG: GMP reductase [Chitinophagales bacterium]
MRIENELKLDYKDVLFRPKRSTLTSREEVDLRRKFTFKNSQQTWQGVPLMAANMDTVGTVEMAKALAKHKIITCLHKFHIPEQLHTLFETEAANYTAVSCGIKEDDITYLGKIMQAVPNVRFICLDVANGYTQRFASVVQTVREKYPDKIIIAGNVVTGEMVEELILRGADIVKVGIGSGSVCTTRIQTGVGYPQLSAVIECSDAAHGVGGQIIADGGCVVPGDVAKAFGGGADFAMLGGMLAGHEQCEGELQIIHGEQYKVFYGMSSDTAMNKYYGEVAGYRSSEGKTVRVKYRGDVNDTVKSILGGIRSTCTYIGAKTLKDMSKCTTFIRVSQQSNEVFGKNS